MELEPTPLYIRILELDPAPLKLDAAPLELDDAPLELDTASLELDVAPLELDTAPLELDGVPLELKVLSPLPPEKLCYGRHSCVEMHWHKKTDKCYIQINP